MAATNVVGGHGVGEQTGRQADRQADRELFTSLADKWSAGRKTDRES